MEQLDDPLRLQPPGAIGESEDSSLVTATFKSCVCLWDSLLFSKEGCTLKVKADPAGLVSKGTLKGKAQH